MNRFRNVLAKEAGEVSSWLMLALALAIAALAASSTIESVLDDLGAEAGGVVRTTASQYMNPIPVLAPGGSGGAAAGSSGSGGAAAGSSGSGGAAAGSSGSGGAAAGSSGSGGTAPGPPGSYPAWDGSPIVGRSGNDLSSGQINHYIANGTPLSNAEVLAAYREYNETFGLTGAGVWRSTDPAERFAAGRDPNSYHLIGAGMDIGSQTSINNLGTAEAQARMAAFARWATQHMSPDGPFDYVGFGQNRYHLDHVHVDINPEWRGPFPRP